MLGITLYQVFFFKKKEKHANMSSLREYNSEIMLIGRTSFD